MINSLTNNYTNKIQIDRITKLNLDNNTKFIITNPDEIHNKVKKYYNIFRRRKSNFNNLDNFWKNQYESLSHINENCYNNILNRPSNQELLDTIKDLPNNKASELSEITNKIIKKLSKKEWSNSMTFFTSV